MSTNFIEIVKIDDVKVHPNADKLELAVIRGTQSVTMKGAFKPGDTAVFFPPDMLIPEHVAELLGVKKYLKHAVINGFKQQCRVAACRLRGEPSFGFIIPVADPNLNEAVRAAFMAEPERIYQVGENVDHWFDAQKYEPPVRFVSADAEREDARFHKYTSIEHYWRYPDSIALGTPVRITEKIHGTNSRVGFIQKPDGQMELMAGSHKVRRKNPASFATVDEEGNPVTPRKSLYWSPLSKGNVVDLLTYLCLEFRRDDALHSAILFGEIYGGSVQDMDYGTPGATGYRVFDISLDGQYLNWSDVKTLCERFSIELVPLLYEGPISPEVVKEHTYGPTTLATADQIQSKFKLREGCVITPLTEVFYAPTGGRLILKSVSADYLDRKGAKDEGDLPDGEESAVE